MYVHLSQLFVATIVRCESLPFGALLLLAYRNCVCGRECKKGLEKQVFSSYQLQDKSFAEGKQPLTAVDVERTSSKTSSRDHHLSIFSDHVGFAFRRVANARKTRFNHLRGSLPSSTHLMEGVFRRVSVLHVANFSTSAFRSFQVVLARNATRLQ